MTPIVWQPGMTIEQGIYLGMPEHIYFGTNAISVSGLKDFRVAPAKYKFGERENTTSLSIGKLWHTGLLEPHMLDVRFMPTDVARRGTKAWDAAEADAGSRELVKREDWDEMIAMRSSVFGQGGALIDCLTHPDMLPEVSFFWWDHPAGVFCRGRADLLVLEHGIAGDVKSCQHADDEFEKAVKDYLYGWQAHFYCRGLRRLGIEIGDFVFFAIEKSKPYLTRPWVISEDDLSHADRIISQLLIEYAECLRTGIWPAYPTEIGTIKLPSFWLQKQ